MHSKPIVALALASAVALFSHAARADTLTENPDAAVPEAADQTLGTALQGAFVHANGDVEQPLSSDGVSATRTGTGTYLVTFSRSQYGCVPVAMADTPTVSINVHGPQVDADTWEVTTYNLDGNLIDSNFSMIVFCSR